MKSIVFTVTNDLSFDQRMDRICTSLTEAGFDCTLIGRTLPTSIPLQDKAYKQVRLQCAFHKGKLFYLEYNIRLLGHLLTNRFDIYSAVDLDTCLPVYSASRLLGKRFVFDAHEYFSELEEVVTRPVVHKVWSWVEKFIMKRAKHCYTISEGYATLFNQHYGAHFKVVRNVPRLASQEEAPLRIASTRRPFVIYQGALNIGRGLEESIVAMKSVPELDLRIFGDGPIRDDLSALIKSEGLEGQVFLEGALPPNALRNETRSAFAGLTLFSAKGLHHQHSLANRFFDYMHAGIPQVTIGHSEYKRFAEQYPVALLIETLSADEVSKALRDLQEPLTYQKIVDAAKEASQRHNWENEESTLLEIYRSL